MNQTLTHLLRSPFVTATGAAAFVHSTWTLATIFGGQHPIIVDLPSAANWLAWVLPAAMIAFALDVGQINTSLQIATLHDQGKRPWTKYVTFLVFAVATYYLQWFHLIHHMPALAYSPGIVQTDFIATLRTAAIWIIPGLLPLSTLLYTFSHQTTKEAEPSTFLIPTSHATASKPAHNGSAPEVADAPANVVADLSPLGAELIQNGAGTVAKRSRRASTNGAGKKSLS